MMMPRRDACLPSERVRSRAPLDGVRGGVEELVEVERDHALARGVKGAEGRVGGAQEEREGQELLRAPQHAQHARTHGWLAGWEHARAQANVCMHGCIYGCMIPCSACGSAPQPQPLLPPTAKRRVPTSRATTHAPCTRRPRCPGPHGSGRRRLQAGRQTCARGSHLQSQCAQLQRVKAQEGGVEHGRIQAVACMRDGTTAQPAMMHARWGGEGAGIQYSKGMCKVWPGMCMHSFRSALIGGQVFLPCSACITGTIGLCAARSASHPAG